MRLTVQQKMHRSITLACSIPVLSVKEQIAFAPLSSVTGEEMIVIFTTRLVSHYLFSLPGTHTNTLTLGKTWKCEAKLCAIVMCSSICV